MSCYTQNQNDLPKASKKATGRHRRKKMESITELNEYGDTGELGGRKKSRKKPKKSKARKSTSKKRKGGAIKPALTRKAHEICKKIRRYFGKIKYSKLFGKIAKKLYAGKHPKSYQVADLKKFVLAGATGNSQFGNSDFDIEDDGSGEYSELAGRKRRKSRKSNYGATATTTTEPKKRKKSRKSSFRKGSSSNYLSRIVDPIQSYIQEGVDSFLKRPPTTIKEKLNAIEIQNFATFLFSKIYPLWQRTKREIRKDQVAMATGNPSYATYIKNATHQTTIGDAAVTLSYSLASEKCAAKVKETTIPARFFNLVVATMKNLHDSNELADEVDNFAIAMLSVLRDTIEVNKLSTDDLKNIISNGYYKNFGKTYEKITPATFTKENIMVTPEKSDIIVKEIKYEFTSYNEYGATQNFGSRQSVNRQTSGFGDDDDDGDFYGRANIDDFVLDSETDAEMLLGPADDLATVFNQPALLGNLGFDPFTDDVEDLLGFSQIGSQPRLTHQSSNVGQGYDPSVDNPYNIGATIENTNTNYDPSVDNPYNVAEYGATEDDSRQMF